MDTFLKEQLQSILDLPVKWNCPLADYTSINIGGPAEGLCVVQNREELQQVLAFAEAHRIPWRAIGRGTNLLVRDEGFAGIIIILGEEFQQISCLKKNGSGKYLVKAGGGCGLARLSVRCMEDGLSGLEFAGGIPGSVAGAVVMNAGAWGGQIADILTRVDLVSSAGKIVLMREELQFGYRNWLDFGKYRDSHVLVAAEFELHLEDHEKIRTKCRELQERRRQTQPRGVANAGSFFQNPDHDSAGRLIDASGCKGKQIGGAKVSEVHANFLVNCGGATAADMFSLMHFVQDKVKHDSGIELEPEVHFL